MMPSRQADVLRTPATDAAERRAIRSVGAPTAVVLPPGRVRRHGGRLRRLQEPAPAGLRERLVQALRAHSSL